MKPKAKIDCELEISHLTGTREERTERHAQPPTALGLCLWHALWDINLKDPEKDSNNKPVLKFQYLPWTTETLPADIPASALATHHPCPVLQVHHTPLLNTGSLTSLLTHLDNGE